mmetsp:Transcript_8422/g.20675  ORF Transcript_8422/g.20675 Transcript_8422/m.20675 type:complete len:204 (+) Transcript_8422:1311-1922(+)
MAPPNTSPYVPSPIMSSRSITRCSDTISRGSLCPPLRRTFLMDPSTLPKTPALPFSSTSGASLPSLLSPSAPTERTARPLPPTEMLCGSQHVDATGELAPLLPAPHSGPAGTNAAPLGESAAQRWSESSSRRPAALACLHLTISCAKAPGNQKSPLPNTPFGSPPKTHPPCRRSPHKQPSSHLSPLHALFRRQASNLRENRPR